MRKLVLFLIVFALAITNPVNGQKGGLLKKVTKSMTDELLGSKPGEGSKNKNADQPEPSSACSDAIVVMDMGGKLQLDYKELSISITEDGRILARHAGSDEYYIVKDGVTKGPYRYGDPQLADFALTRDVYMQEDEEEDEAKIKEKEIEDFIKMHKPYISRSGKKFIITFAGKTYGPYAMINNFTVSKSKDQFAAFIVENIIISEDEGDAMDEAIKNAKTDQEKMDLAMQYTQMISDRTMEAGGPGNIAPKFISNIPDATFDPMSSMGSGFSGEIKYDQIIVLNPVGKIMDLMGNTLLTVNQDDINAEKLFVNTAGTKYAAYNYGTLKISDNTTLDETFSPRLIKTDGKVYIAYMYYSPKKNAIMQCKIPF